MRHDHHTNTPRDAALAEHHATDHDRLDAALMAGFDPHPDDLRRPPAHLDIDGDPLTVFDAEVKAVRAQLRRTA